MIKNELEYRITKLWMKKFEVAIQEFLKETHEDQHPLLVKAQIDSMKSQLQDLEIQVYEYEKERRSQTLFDLQKLLLEGKKFYFKARNIDYVLSLEVHNNEARYIIMLKNSPIDSVSWGEFEKAVLHIFALIGEMH